MSPDQTDTSVDQNPYWLEVSLKTDGEAAEAVAGVLQPYAYAGGVVFEQLGTASSPDPTALEVDVTVKIYIPDSRDTPELRRKIEEACYHLNRLYPVPAPQFKKIVDSDWATVWQKDYKPFRIGERIWISPSWVNFDAESTGEFVITLDPGMAFGTGLHPTTQMCLMAIEKHVSPGFQVLDVGTGSGILSIASLRLGARRVIAFDTDLVATKTAIKNAAINHVAGKLSVFQGELAAVMKGIWDLVLVNILAPVIIEMLDTVRLIDYLAPTGQLVLSGIIDQQVLDVRQALEKANAEVVDRLQVGDWVTLIVEKKDARSIGGHDVRKQKSDR